MKRRQWLEIEDQAWCPQVIRDAVTDCLQFVVTATQTYAPVAAPLAQALRAVEARHVLDLCSGGAGPWLWLQPVLASSGLQITVRLSDKFPNHRAFQRAHQNSRGAITCEAGPVDAARVPPEFDGFRTLFNSFHHFRPAEARALLRDAVRQGRGIAIFEVTRREPLALLQVLLFPVAVLAVTPWIRPFRWSRLLWTYLVPLVPLVTLIDGLVSCLRSYTAAELRQMTAELDGPPYRWEVQVVRARRWAVPVTYLIGLPVAANPVRS